MKLNLTCFFIYRKDKESQDKSRNVKNGGDAAVEDSWDTPADAAAAPEPVVAAEKDFAKPFNENGPPRKNYERKPPRERKFENSDQNQSSRPFNNQYNKRNYNNSGNYNSSNSGNNSGGNYYNKDDDWGTKTWDENEAGDGGAAGDNAANRFQSNENRNVRENGYGPHTGSEYRPRGGGRFRGDSRGGRRYTGPDRRKEYNNDQQNEQ